MSKSEACKVNGTSAPEAKINLTTIKRSDQYINRIISTTSHVEVYKFDDSARTWERTTTEGSLFIYNRAEMPAFAFVVLNRLNSGNILQFIIPGMEFKKEGSFVMYKSTDDIYCGLHFDDATECQRVGDTLIGISTDTNSNSAGQNVVQMLEKAFHQSAEGSIIAEQKQKAIELRKSTPRRSSDPNANASPRKGAGKQQRLGKPTKKEPRTHSPSKSNTTIQEISAKANTERVSTKHLSRANAEEFQDLKRQLFRSPERTRSKEIPSKTGNTLSVGSGILSSSLPHTMLSLAEVEKKLHSSVTTASSNSSSSSVVSRPRSVEYNSQSQLIDPSSFAVPAATALPNSKSAIKLTKSASMDVKPLSQSFSQPMLADGSTLQIPSHFPPVPPIMVSPGMRSAPVSSSSDQGLTMKSMSSSSTTVQIGLMYTPKQQQPTSTTAEGKPLPPSSYQTPNRQANVESAGKELVVSKAQGGSQNGLLSPMVFQDNPAVNNAHKPTPKLNREQFLQAMLYMIQNDKDFSDRLYQAYQQSLSDSLQ